MSLPLHLRLLVGKDLDRVIRTYVKTEAKREAFKEVHGQIKDRPTIRFVEPYYLPLCTRYYLAFGGGPFWGGNELFKHMWRWVFNPVCPCCEANIEKEEHIGWFYGALGTTNVQFALSCSLDGQRTIEFMKKQTKTPKWDYDLLDRKARFKYVWDSLDGGYRWELLHLQTK